ncbi:hypothetical protein LTR85_008087 [Meristemomyces frigidus]|nr:hypothetical protein LTR85_008087 [Meristemomyces frigidus]
MASNVLAQQYFRQLTETPALIFEIQSAHTQRIFELQNAHAQRIFELQNANAELKRKVESTVSLKTTAEIYSRDEAVPRLAELQEAARAHGAFLREMEEKRDEWTAQLARAGETEAGLREEIAEMKERCEGTEQKLGELKGELESSKEEESLLLTELIEMIEHYLDAKEKVRALTEQLEAGKETAAELGNEQEAMVNAESEGDDDRLIVGAAPATGHLSLMPDKQYVVVVQSNGINFKFTVVVDYGADGGARFLRRKELPGQLMDRITGLQQFWQSTRRGQTGELPRELQFPPPGCVTSKLVNRAVRWKIGYEGRYACADCVMNGLPCFTFDGQVYKLLPVHPQSRCGGQADEPCWNWIAVFGQPGMRGQLPAAEQRGYAGREVDSGKTEPSREATPAAEWIQANRSQHERRLVGNYTVLSDATVPTYNGNGN